MPRFQFVSSRGNVIDQVLSINIGDRLIRMVPDYNVSAHPGMDFTNDLHHSRCYQRFSTHPSRIKSHIELWLVAREIGMRSMENRIRIFENHELPNARCYDMGNESASYVIQLVNGFFFYRLALRDP